MKLEVDGKQVFAYTANHDIDPAKRTVVFVHGAGLDHSWFGLQSRYFGYHGWNVLAVDLPGHGRSAGPALTSVPAMADWLPKVLSSVKVQKAAIVGHSMGSLVALEFAARHSAQAECIALIAVAFPMRVSAAFLDAAQRDHLDAFDMHTIWGHAPRVPLAGNPNPGMWMYGDTLARLRRLAPGVLHTDLRACNDYADGLESAAKVKCPVLFILGDSDVMTPVKATASLARAIEQERTVQIPPSGHSLMAEAPDATLDALVEFLR